VDLQSLKQRYGILGNTPSLNYALQVAIQVAPTDLSVLITGESGVGKEVFSQLIHQLSTRKHNPFIAVNCGAIPEGTIDSELFGHEKGSFTGAVDARKGYFETVSGGTIFLDEIAEMPLGTQARLLRVLETGEFIKVGSSKVLKTDVRVIAATNVNLKEMITQGKFREDLFYRLNTVPIKVPSLRERKDDIPLLFRKFCIDFADKYRSHPISLDESARQILLSYHWPGNIRELKNMAEQVSVLSSQKEINAAEMLRFMPDGKLDSLPALINAPGSKQQFTNEREMMYQVLFDMKKDVNDLKKAFSNILQGQPLPTDSVENDFFDQAVSSNSSYSNNTTAVSNNPVVQAINPNQPLVLQQSAEIEESLNIADREKELIIKALKKHKSRRRNAATELGISERTLYRKVKEYNLENL
jgi:transcriptional regulator with PAS, ATPase and Fis domain